MGIDAPKPSSTHPDRNFFIPTDLEELMKYAANNHSPFLVPGLTKFNWASTFEIRIINRLNPENLLVITKKRNEGGIKLYEVHLEPLLLEPSRYDPANFKAIELKTTDEVIKVIKNFAVPRKS